MDGGEDRRQLWEPILNLGASAHYWVEGFLHAWFRAGLSSETVPTSFLAEWQLMIEYAASLESWRVGGGRSSYRATENWQALLGLNQSDRPLWR